MKEHSWIEERLFLFASIQTEGLFVQFRLTTKSLTFGRYWLEELSPMNVWACSSFFGDPRTRGLKCDVVHLSES